MDDYKKGVTDTINTILEDFAASRRNLMDGMNVSDPHDRIRMLEISQIFEEFTKQVKNCGERLINGETA